MTYDEYKAATRTTADPLPDSLVALSQINRLASSKSFDDTCTAVATGDMKKTSSRPIEGRRISCDERSPTSQFAPPSKDAMDAFARINLRKARRTTMSHSSSITKDNDDACHDTKPPNLKPGQAPHSEVARIKKSTSPSNAHARRPSLWGGILNTLSAEVAPLPVAKNNRRSSDGPGAPQPRGDASDLRKKAACTACRQLSALQ